MELTHQLTPMLRTLRLSGILETLDIRNRQAVEQQASCVEFLTLLLQDEVERRAQSRLRLRLRRAAFDPTKTLESFDFSFNPKLNKAQLFDIATRQFIERHEFRPRVRPDRRGQEPRGAGARPRSLSARL